MLSKFVWQILQQQKLIYNVTFLYLTTLIMPWLNCNFIPANLLFNILSDSSLMILCFQKQYIICYLSYPNYIKFKHLVAVFNLVSLCLFEPLSKSKILTSLVAIKNTYKKVIKYFYNIIIFLHFLLSYFVIYNFFIYFPLSSYLKLTYWVNNTAFNLFSEVKIMFLFDFLLNLIYILWYFL